MTLEQFNLLDKETAKAHLLTCCGSENWANRLLNKFPFKSSEDLIAASDSSWNECGKSDWLEAFNHHPKIGDLKSLEEKFSSTKAWASGEQASVNAANQEVLLELSTGNQLYEEKFGFIFIVCATGKSAEEMLSLLRARINNSREQELFNARDEQNKITHLRLKKLIA
jgi:2-oxo-4-hydroxy-4-carboxy-5-ureidoimidazoline decarboxylase